MDNKGLLVTFEGLDGAGKSTQMKLLEMYFKQRGIDYVATREPGGSLLGKDIRRLILNPPADGDMSPLAEAFLFHADRAEHFSKVVLPALDNDTIVLCDRCLDSSIVYQGFALNIGVAYIEQLSVVAMQGRMPDLTILLDLPPEEVYTRKGKAMDASRFDKAALDFHRQLQSAFIAQSNANPQRIKVVDATKDIQQVHQEIIAALMTKFPLEVRGLHEETKMGRWFDKEDDDK